MRCGVNQALAGAVITVLVGLLAACAPPPSGKLVLTIQNSGCTTVPSGSVSVDPGAVTTISATAYPPHSWPGTNGWTVVSGTASIANANLATTTVTLNTGDATILATCP